MCAGHFPWGLPAARLGQRLGHPHGPRGCLHTERKHGFLVRMEQDRSDVLRRHHGRGEAPSTQGENVSHPFPHESSLSASPLAVCWEPADPVRAAGDSWTPQGNLGHHRDLRTAQVLFLASETAPRQHLKETCPWALPLPQPQSHQGFPGTETFITRTRTVQKVEQVSPPSPDSWDKAALLQERRPATFPLLSDPLVLRPRVVHAQFCRDRQRSHRCVHPPCAAADMQQQV